MALYQGIERKYFNSTVKLPQTSLHLHMMLNEQAAVTKHFPEYFKN